jgi:hypothetical protein
MMPGKALVLCPLEGTFGRARKAVELSSRSSCLDEVRVAEALPNKVRVCYLVTRLKPHTV